MKIKLSKPFEFEVGGKKVRHTVLEIPLEEMTGSDMIAVENQLQGEGKFTMLGDFSKQFQIRLASRALKIPVQILERLPLRDFNKVVTAVQGFLLGSESGSPEEEQQEEKTEIPLAKASNA